MDLNQLIQVSNKFIQALLACIVLQIFAILLLLFLRKPQNIKTETKLIKKWKKLVELLTVSPPGN